MLNEDNNEREVEGCCFTRGMRAMLEENESSVKLFLEVRASREGSGERRQCR